MLTDWFAIGSDCSCAAAFGPAIIGLRKPAELGLQEEEVVAIVKSSGRRRMPDPPPGWLGSETCTSRLVALIAAHNEERSIRATLLSLAAQTRPPDEVIVVADRCTDRTVEIAVACGARVFKTFDNRHRKAGALNQVLTTILADLDPSDHVLLMDADTVLSPGFLAAAETRLRVPDEGRPLVGAVGAVFLGHDGS